MKIASLNLALTSLVGWLLFTSHLSAQSPVTTKSESVLLTVEGKVEIARAGSTQWSPGRTNLLLSMGDRLRTGVRSRATVRLSNLTVLRVNELTTFQIQPPTAPGKHSLLDLRSGSVYFLSRERPTEMEFRTPLASGAIRGTEFHLAVAENGRSVVTLIDGEIALSNAQGPLDLTSGEQAIVEPGKAPAKTAVIETINIIQWCLYYPAVLDLGELELTAAEKETLAASLEAYRAGDLLQALANYPENRAPASDAERVYLAELLLSVGQVEQAEAQLRQLQTASPLAEALRVLIAAVKFQARPSTLNLQTSTALATEWLAESYYLQSRSELAEALAAARAAVAKSPNFGFGRARVAELEFSFGRIPAALDALERSLQISPRNAEALALKGFLLAAQNKIPEAKRHFEDALAVDGALGNAWLGRGLVRIRQGDAAGGVQDLQVAATLEPQRALLRSYLGKAFSNARDNRRAGKELALARKLDPNDPTAWLYSALLDQQENEINEAVRDLEKSKELNDNRRLFRSRLLLDQDRAVRSANLAAIYQDAGMVDLSVREASRAVNYDYGNYSAHQFLANSYDALRDPKQINLRYETPWFSELLVANLLAPVGAGNLSQYVSQQEYSKLFERDRFGLSSSTEYLSRGDWFERGSQYGTFGNTSYALDAEYRSQNGDRPNNDLQQTTLTAKFKQQLTPQDSVFLQAQYYDTEFSDVAQYYNHDGRVPGVRAPSPTFRGTERQEPNLFIGYHREWSPGSHTLFLAGRLDDTLTLKDAAAQINFVQYTTFVQPREIFRVRAFPFPIAYERDFEAYSVELQQIWQTPSQSLVVGSRFQSGWANTSSTITNLFNASVQSQETDTDLVRFSVYGYEQWQILDTLQLTAGVSYDRLRFPRNIDTSPITSDQRDADQVSPKAGFIWTPEPNTHLRGAYTRSLGGLSYDTSVRLEPTQVAGFNQAFRSAIPESAVGLVPGTRFETASLALDHAFKTGTYLGVEAELLTSEAERLVGVFTNAFFAVADSPSETRQSLDFEEKSLVITLNQLLGREWSVGGRYRLSQAQLTGRFEEIPRAVAKANGVDQDETATLHQLNLFAIYNHPSGFFVRAESIWSQQSNRGYTPAIPGDDFWQFNAFVGYRFYRRTAELRLGLLNITDQNYRLNPLNLYYELPRQRTLSVSFRFYF